MIVFKIYSDLVLSTLVVFYSFLIQILFLIKYIPMNFRVNRIFLFLFSLIGTHYFSKTI